MQVLMQCSWQMRRSGLLKVQLFVSMNFDLLEKTSRACKRSWLGNLKLLLLCLHQVVLLIKIVTPYVNMGIPNAAWLNVPVSGTLCKTL